MKPKPIEPDRFDAALFDLDGVITRTAKLHATAWKRMFDEFLLAAGVEREPFDIARDYARYVDGKPRYDGVESFLASRGIDLPHGSPSDPPDARTICGLGNRKNSLVLELIDEVGVEVFDDAVELLEALRRRGFKTAIVSSSKNCEAVLRSVDLWDSFDQHIDGVVAERRHLRGKPAPDTYLAGARALDAQPSRAIVFEDAIAGVESGRAGGFGLVVGVDRTGSASELLDHGADVATDDLTLLVPRPR